MATCYDWISVYDGQADAWLGPYLCSTVVDCGEGCTPSTEWTTEYEYVNYPCEYYFRTCTDTPPDPPDFIPADCDCGISIDPPEQDDWYIEAYQDQQACVDCRPPGIDYAGDGYCVSWGPDSSYTEENMWTGLEYNGPLLSCDYLGEAGPVAPCMSVSYSSGNYWLISQSSCGPCYLGFSPNLARIFVFEYNEGTEEYDYLCEVYFESPAMYWTCRTLTRSECVCTLTLMDGYDFPTLPTAIPDDCCPSEEAPPE
jgi:hypothetical protein